MTLNTQKTRAIQFRELHHGPSPLLLPNAWDAASACILAQTGFKAIATTSSGVAASLGYPDGQHISREMLIEVVARMARVITCPLSVDLEAGYGENIAEVLKTVKAIIAAGAVGINIEDSTKRREQSLVDVSFQVELLKAIREMASSMDMPLVINARTDVFLLPAAPSINRGATGGFEEAVQRLNAYRRAGADCLFPIGVSDAGTIANLVQAIQGPINIIAGPRTPALPELAQLGVARVSFASGLMRATLAHLRRIARELLGPGTYTTMSEMVLMADLRNCFEGELP
jgi:2-methylisocitrate lyase-like PEP mutase family enzyme